MLISRHGRQHCVVDQGSLETYDVFCLKPVYDVIHLDGVSYAA